MEGFPQKKQVLHSFCLVIHNIKSSKNNQKSLIKVHGRYFDGLRGELAFMLRSLSSLVCEFTGRLCVAGVRTERNRRCALRLYSGFVLSVVEAPTPTYTGHILEVDHFSVESLNMYRLEYAYG